MIDLMSSVGHERTFDGEVNGVDDCLIGDRISVIRIPQFNEEAFP